MEGEGGVELEMEGGVEVGKGEGVEPEEERIWSWRRKKVEEVGIELEEQDRVGMEVEKRVEME